MVGCKGDDGVSECGFPENGGGKVCRCSVQRYVKVVYVAVHFCLCCEMKFRVYGVEVICMSCMLDWQVSNIIRMSSTYL